MGRVTLACHVENIQCRHRIMILFVVDIFSYYMYFVISSVHSSLSSSEPNIQD